MSQIDHLGCGTVAIWGGHVPANIDHSDGDVHVIPQFDLDPLHLEHETCWCEPEMVEYNEITDVAVWTHRQVQ